MRLIGLVLAAIPFLMGFVLILFDGRRRGLQDVLARTVVIEVPEQPVVPRARRAADGRA